MPTLKTDPGPLLQRLNRRVASLERERLQHEPVWKEIRANFEPFFGTALDGIQTDPQNRTAKPDTSSIINSHPRLCVHRGAAGMQGGITNPATQWFNLTAEDPALRERNDVKEYTDAVTQISASSLQRSNVYSVTSQIYAHLLCFATSAAIIAPDDESDINATLLDEGSYWIACNSKGRVTTLLRCYAATAAQLRDDFGLDALDPTVKAALDRQQDETWYTVYNLICPNDGSCKADIDPARPFLSVYWRKGQTEAVLAIRSFGYNPILAPRFTVLSGSYGFGPGHIALPDAKELQRLEEDILAAGAKRVEPPMVAPASMRHAALNTFPGGVTFTPEDAVGSSDDKSLRPLYEMRLDTSDIRASSQEVAARLDRIFYLDLFAMMLSLSSRPKQMTAREVNELAQEKMSLLGPVLTRMDTDLLDPLIDAVFYILAEKGRLPPPPEVLSGAQLSIKYISVLHTEQQSVSRLGSMIKLADFMAMIAPASPDCVDKLDADQAIDQAANVLNVPAGVIRSDADVAKLRNARAEQQAAQMQAMQAAAAAPGIARAAKDASQTRQGTGSLLDDTLSALQPQE